MSENERDRKKGNNKKCVFDIIESDASLPFRFILLTYFSVARAITTKIKEKHIQNTTKMFTTQHSLKIRTKEQNP